MFIPLMLLLTAIPSSFLYVLGGRDLGQYLAIALVAGILANHIEKWRND